MKLSALPEDTKVYPGHEYTLSNYRFLESIDKSNINLIEAYECDKKKREAGEFTIPSTIGLELLTNAFMRVNDINIINALGCTVDTDPIEVLAKCRTAKNNFK
jgi:hydroxyacylglutathione hydrolase